MVELDTETEQELPGESHIHWEESKGVVVREPGREGPFQKERIT